MASTPDQAAKDWVAGLSAKTTKMRAGAGAVTMAPGQAAARQSAAYLAGVQANVQKFARNVGRVTLSEWLDAYVNKGIPRIATGAAAAEGKMTSFFSEFLPFVERGRSSLPARGTFEQNKARLNAWIDYVHGFKRSGG